MSNERRNLVVTALLLSLMCNSVGGSRLMKLTVSSSSRAVVVNTVEPWKQPPPPPPLYIQWPPTHHHVRHHQSPPPAPTSAPTPEPAPAPTPPAVHNNVTSSPPPPPDQGTTTLNAKHSQPNGRRLFSSGERDADFGSNQFLLGTDHESSVGECAGGALAPGATHEAGIPFGGSGYGPVPEGAPVPGVVPVIPGPGPGPAPAPAPGISSGSVPALAPSVAGDNSTMAHSTMYNQCTYTVITSTGNIEGAGTKADVNAEFFDKFGSSVLFVNLRSQNRNFEQGATDTFTVVGDCVQNICKMHLSHDDSGPNPGWFVNTVTVSVLYQTHVFNVFEWLAKDEPPYSLSRVVSSCPAL